MHTDQYSAILHLPFAVVGVKVDGEAISGIEFLPENTPERVPENAVIQELVLQLEWYLADPVSSQLDIPIHTKGTSFQQRVWAALRKIPPGSAVTYGELAKQLNSGARAVGNACRRNPVPLIVPCHRVVSSQGLGGFAGDRHDGWTRIKRRLLAHEGYCG